MTTNAPLDLDALAAEMSAEGWGEFVDFFISNRADGTLTSSELVCLSFRDDVYRVWYRDMGQNSEILRTSDPAEARRVFLDQTRALVADRYPGRRPRVEPPPRESPEAATARLLGALAKLPKYRGLSFRGLDPGASAYRPGEIVVSPVLIATTMDLRLATQNFAIDRVLAIFGTLGRSLEAHSQHPQEREVLYLPSTVYKIGETMHLDGLEVALVEQIDLDRDPSSPPWTTIEQVRALVEKHVPLARQRPDVELMSRGKFAGALT